MVGAEGDDGAPERDDDPVGPRPDPLDRPWVHPSELRSYVANPTNTPQVRPREWVIGVASAVAGVVVTVLVLVAFGALGDRTRSPLPPPIPTNENTAIDFGVAARVGQAVEPSIVTVSVKKGDATEIASGVAVKSNRVLASAHVVAGATAITVATSDKSNYDAKVMGTDPDTDLALLDVAEADLTYPALADDAAEVGDAVVAVAVSKNDAPFVDLGIVTGQNVLVDTTTGTTLAGLVARRRVHRRGDVGRWAVRHGGPAARHPRHPADRLHPARGAGGPHRHGGRRAPADRGERQGHPRVARAHRARTPTARAPR